MGDPRSDQPDRKADLERSWVVNAPLWTEAVRSGSIASRRLGTDTAIIEAALKRQPRRVLDLGCGEGWLTRALGARGIDAVGVDASPPLIEQARRDGGGRFHLAGYRQIATDPTAIGSGYDAIIANFALLQDDLSPLLQALRRSLAAGGALIIQTIHPMTAGAPYRDGWRMENFHGFGESAEWQPMPWYFRTLASWLDLLRRSGYALIEMREPLHPATELPLSLLLVARPV